jgi:hypothetical protein
MKPPRIYINLVEIKKMKEFKQYLKKFNVSVLCWLDEWFEEGKK